MHAAVFLFEQGHDQHSLDGIVLGKSRATKPKGVKDNNRHNLKVRKPSEPKSMLQPILNEWVDNANSQLNAISTCQELGSEETKSVVVNQEGELEVAILIEPRDSQQPVSASVEMEANTLAMTIDLGPLVDLLVTNSFVPDLIKVEAMVNNQGEWLWDWLNHLLQINILLRISAIKGPALYFPTDSIG
ncbi:hypothetical protein V6N12_051139 [Hibiscus sabdariffa]|uniref:Uncharacterized protein n=1 Tax=Hibiscus sabdariffa TaxID=183260 RepID=A0ABR2GFC0_9ROSI